MDDIIFEYGGWVVAGEKFLVQVGLSRVGENRKLSSTHAESQPCFYDSKTKIATHQWGCAFQFNSKIMKKNASSGCNVEVCTLYITTIYIKK